MCNIVFLRKKKEKGRKEERNGHGVFLSEKKEKKKEQIRNKYSNDVDRSC